MALRVMSYNVRYFAHALRGAGSTRGCLNAIASAIAGMEVPPDIICLQEVETRSLRSHFSLDHDNGEQTQLDALQIELAGALESFRRKERYRGHYFPAHTYKFKNGRALYSTGLAVLAQERLSVTEHNIEEPTDITHRRIARLSGLKQSRICAYVRFEDDKKESIEIFNTHLSLPAFATKKFFSKKEPNMGYGDNQAEEVDTLMDFVNSKRKTDRFLLMGDFNSLPGSPAYLRLVEKSQMVDPFPAIVGQSPIELRTSWPTAGFMNLRMRLDHMFMGPALSCVDFRDTHPFGVVGRWHGLSDHVPLVARFEHR